MKLQRLIWFLLIALLPGQAFTQSANVLPPIKYDDYRLKNGLRVLLYYDNSAPVVAVNVFYHVGSKDEAPGKTGFAHLFEHLMFQGSRNYRGNFRAPLEQAGASRINGITTSDTTNYFEVVPSNFLELALFLEADRMGGLLDGVTQEQLDIQRDVVKNERRENFDNRPYATWREKAYEFLYPPDHPYRWHPIGSMKDISAASLDDVKTFFRRYYVPNNAILSVAGAFDEKQAKQWIEKYFGGIPKGAAINRPKPAPPELKGELCQTVEDSVPGARSYLVWHGVPKYHADEAAIEVLSKILNSGRSSRLFGKLVLQKQIAQSVGLFQENKELAGLVFINIIPGSAKPLAEIEKEVEAELERIRKEPPTSEEVARAINRIESDKLFELETALVAGDKLGEYALYLNKPDYFQADLESYRNVKPADVQRVVNRYLTGNRLVLTYVPRKTAVSVPDPKAVSAKPAGEQQKNDPLIEQQTANLPKPGANPKFSLPPIEKGKLSNGLEVWIARRSRLPIVQLTLSVKSGVTAEPEEKQGVYALTAGLLQTGTKTRSATDLSDQLLALGTTVNSFLGTDSLQVSVRTLSRNLDQVLDIYADIIINPAFPEADFERGRRRTLDSLVQQQSDPKEIANRVYLNLLYGKSPYARPLWGSPEDIKRLSRDDLLQFHRSNFVPKNSVLIVAGDLEKKPLMPRLEKAFGNWKPGAVAATAAAKPEPIEETTIFLIDRPGSPQSTIRLAQLGAARSSPDYFGMLVLNSVLGWGPSSRVSANLRQSKGYAYEAGLDFVYHTSVGHFVGWANVETGVTKESIVEFLKEINRIQAEVPVTQKELQQAKEGLMRSFPANFEELAALSFKLSESSIYGLPDMFLTNFMGRVDAVTLADVTRIANKYLTTNRMPIVIVGDRKVIEPGLKELGFPLEILDIDGNAVR